LLLRGHHLVCLHFYHGKGYNREFIQNLNEIMERARSGEAVEIVEGPDQVCRLCRHLGKDGCASEPGAEDEIKALDLKALILYGKTFGERVLWSSLAERLANTSPQWFNDFCAGCSWQQVCDRYRAEDHAE